MLAMRAMTQSGTRKRRSRPRDVKIVEWSEEIFEQLCVAVEEVIELYKRDQKPLPPPTSGRDYANKMLSVA